MILRSFGPLETQEDLGSRPHLNPDTLFFVAQQTYLFKELIYVYR